jgi:hypothetical protein
MIALPANTRIWIAAGVTDLRRNPEVSFLERADCICDYLDGNFKFRPRIRGVRELNFEGFIFHAPDTRHVLQTQEWQNTFRIEFNNAVL